MQIKHKIAKNTVFNAAFYIFSMAVYFFLLPFIIRRVGVTGFGIYVLVSSLVNYFGLLELGISTSVVKYVSEYHDSGDRKKVAEVISSTFFFYLGLGIVMTAGLLVAATMFLGYFNIPASELAKARLLIYILAFSTAFTLPLSTFRNVLAGLQRYDWIAGMGMAITGATAIATVAVLNAGFGIVELVAIETLFSLTGLIVLTILAIRLLGFQPLGRAHLSKQASLLVAGFSLLIFVIQVANQIAYKTDTIVLGLFLPVGFIALYEAANKIQGLCWRIFRIINSAVMPAVSQLNSAQKTETLQKLYIRGSKYAAAATLSATTALMLTARPLLIFWLGESFGKVTPAAQIFLSFWLFNSLTGITSVVLVGMGRIKWQAALVLSKSLLNLGLSVFLVREVGFIGVIVGTVLSEMVVFPVLIGYALRVLNIKLSVFMTGVVLRVYIPLIIAGGIGYRMVQSYEPRNLFQVGVYALAIMSAYLLVFYVFSTSKQEKKDLSASFVKPIFSKAAALAGRKKMAVS